MWQAVGSCERLPSAPRAELADALVADAARGRTTEQELWALARLGARVPIYGPLNCVVPRERAAAAVERLLGVRVAAGGGVRVRARPDRARLGRSRARSGRRRCASASPRRLETLPDGARLARIVREPVALEAREEARLLDESLPAGLRLRA